MRLSLRHVWIATLAIIVALILAAFFAVSSAAAPERATSRVNPVSQMYSVRMYSKDGALLKSETLTYAQWLKVLKAGDHAHGFPFQG